MENKISIIPELDFYKVDGSFDKSELLQRIKEILQEGDSHNAESFNEQNWLWQYKNLPTHDVRIYLCYCENKIVGYYHVPIYEGVIDGEKKNFAMVQDVAVSTTMRGRGVFRKLAEFATDDLVNSDVNLIYTFPNQKSIHTFVKYNGYEQIYVYDSYLFPIDSAAILRSKLKLFGLENLAGWLADKYFDFKSTKLPKDFIVNTEDNFDEETIELFQSFNAKFFCHLNRTKNYLQWRFYEKPIGKHFLITLKNDSTPVAAAVFKLDEILGVKTAVLLDFAFDNEIQLIRLLHYAGKNDTSLFGEKVSMIFISCCCREFLQNKLYGFIKIPLRFSPRPLNLLIKNITENKDKVRNAENWLALLSDWDVL